MSGALRPIAESDLAQVLRWRNSERVRSQMFTDHVISPEEHRAWFDRIQADGSKVCWIYLIDGRPVGLVNVTSIDRRVGTCAWGFYLGETDLPKGTGTEMGEAELKAIFDDLGLTAVAGEAIASNEGSIAFHLRLGFRENGRRSAGAVKNGRPMDVVQFSLGKTDWLKAGKGNVAS